MKTYGILGKSISYSLSPYMHRAAFKAAGIEADYQIFDKTESQLDGFFSDLRKGVILGCNVTIPYKEKAVLYVDKYADEVKSIGALNTIVNRNGRLEGCNTDYFGFRDALTGKARGDLGFEPRGKNVFLFGAGGAAKAIVFSLTRKGHSAKKIIIADVEVEKARTLADSFVKNEKPDTLISVAEDRKQYEEFVSKSDLLINATPCGMKKDDDPLFDYRYMHYKLYVFDLIYSVESSLLKEAKTRAKKAVGGINMLLRQAVYAFSYWVENMDKNVIEHAMRDALMDNIRI